MKSLIFLSAVVFGGNVFAADFSDSELIPDWASSAISELTQEGILSGNSDGTFAPSRQMNRAEFCKVLVNATGVQKYLPLESDFPDVQRDDWFFDYVETAKHYGWIDGYPDGTFLPGNKINRAEAAKILANAFELSVAEPASGEAWYGPYFQALSDNGLLAYGTSPEDLYPQISPSRAEIAEQVSRFMVRAGTLDNSLTEEATTTPTGSSNTSSTTTTSTTSTHTVPSTVPGAVIPSSLPDFEYTEKDPFATKVNSSAGTLYLEKDATLSKGAQVSANQQNITVHKLKLRSENGAVEITGFQFRLIGNANYLAVSDAWLEMDGKQITTKVKPTSNVVTFPLKQTKLSVGSNGKTIVMKIDMSGSPKSGDNFRWVLYLPEWIGANTAKKVGFFPFGGTNVTVK